MDKRKVKISSVDDVYAHSCYFRTSTKAPYRKALLQITERCNLHCAHCFLSAEKEGQEMSFEEFKTKIFPFLERAKVIGITLTGGEPMLHPQIDKFIEFLAEKRIKTTICSNATLITSEQISKYKNFGNVLFNVSLDGFSEESHGKFRGDKKAFLITKKNLEYLAKAKLLKGILVTPNNLAKKEEYSQICNFASELGIEYVLMNPLSSFGRGTNSAEKLEANKNMMNEIRTDTSIYKNKIDVVNVRFPNEENKPLTSCEAGNILYIFSNGDITVCPYLVFASNNDISQYSPSDFIVGNLKKDTTDKCIRNLEKYDFSKLKERKNEKCNQCCNASQCGQGCPADVIARGKKLSDLDALCNKSRSR